MGYQWGVGAVFCGWAQVVMGWPAIVASMAAAVGGLARRQPLWLYVAAVLSLGFSWYLGNTPRFRTIGFLLPILFIGAGLATRRGWRLLGLLFVAPFFAIALWAAWVVLFG